MVYTFTVDLLFFLYSMLISISYTFQFTNVRMTFVGLLSIHPKAFEDIQTTLSHLTLSNNLLDKVPVQSLSLLSELLTIDLQNNCISYLGSHSFQNMTRLADIILSDNEITSISSDAFEGLSYLETLALSNNPLSAKDIQFNIPKVHFLSLYRSEVHNVSQPLFQSNANIHTLILSESNLTILAPTAFSNMGRTIRLHLDKNSLTGDYICNSVVWQNFSSLRILYLHGNELKMVSQQCFGRLTSLTDLRAANTKISQLESGAFEGLDSLISLDLSSNHLQIIENGSMYGLTNLSELFLINNKLSKLTPGAFLSLGQLKVLLLQGNSLQAAPVICSSVWQPLVNLRTLNLANNMISTLSSKCFSDIGSLISLYLDRNNISALEIHSFSGLYNLKNLHLSWNRFEIITNVIFSGTPSLNYLYLRNNKISTIRNGSFASMNLLKGLYLQGNFLTTLSVLHTQMTTNCLIALERNPLNCSCSLSWITSKNYILSSGTKCNHSETNGTYYLKQFLVRYCTKTPLNKTLDDSAGEGEYTHSIIFNSVLLVLVVVIVVIVFVIIRHVMSK